ncbi:hypothetical protein [uncultured Brachyspira sp.]|uniref:hypothetical protein n=1 Tax=uncultured Brachyspira sp. TaxID=221953 RepID=UPI0025DC7D0E|nr:hypothetical protein [uncultured Brachyspira sp.]
MSVKCVWCGEKIEEIQGKATMDTCDECEDFFEEHIDDIAQSLNELLKKNELSSKPSEKKAWISYSLITAIHMLSSKPHIEFKDSKYNNIISRCKNNNF